MTNSESTNSKRFNLRAAAYLILIKDDQILLLRRFNTGWQDGKYSMVAGHLDGNEKAVDAMKREAKEEAGIDIDQKDLQIVHILHRKSKDGLEYIDFFLTTNQWNGEPQNMELDKCDEINWFPLSSLPDNLLPHVKQVIENYKNKISFSEFGWNEDLY